MKYADFQWEYRFSLYLKDIEYDAVEDLREKIIVK